MKKSKEFDCDKDETDTLVRDIETFHFPTQDRALSYYVLSLHDRNHGAKSAASWSQSREA